MRRLPVILTLVACLVPAVALTVEVIATENHSGPSEYSWLIWLLCMISPYLLLAGTALIPIGRVWSWVICVGSFLIAGSGLLAQLDVIAVRGFYGMGWIGLLVIHWYACGIILAVALILQTIVRQTKKQA